MKIKYIGFSDERSLSKSDLKSLDIEHAALVWNIENEFTVDVPAAAGKALLDLGEFEEA